MGPDPAAWLEAQTAAAPPALRARVLEYLEAQPQGADLVTRLSGAGGAALAAVTARPGDRSVALDLLAADALITLALLAQADTAPAALGSVAAGLLEAYGSTP